MLAIATVNRGLGQTGCFVVASIFALLACACLTGALFPRLRQRFRWGFARGSNEGTPMTTAGLLAWTLFTALWAVSFLAQALQFAPIASHRRWILAAGFIIVLAVGVYDNARSRRT